MLCEITHTDTHHYYFHKFLRQTVLFCNTQEENWDCLEPGMGRSIYCKRSKRSFWLLKNGNILYMCSGYTDFKNWQNQWTDILKRIYFSMYTSDPKWFNNTSCSRWIIMLKLFHGQLNDDRICMSALCYSIRYIPLCRKCLNIWWNGN